MMIDDPDGDRDRRFIYLDQQVAGDPFPAQLSEHLFDLVLGQGQGQTKGLLQMRRRGEMNPLGTQ